MPYIKIYIFNKFTFYLYIKLKTITYKIYKIIYIIKLL